HVAGLDQPEAGGAAAILEEPMPGRERDVPGRVREHAQVIARHAVQKRVPRECPRRYFDHGYHRPAKLPEEGSVSSRSPVPPSAGGPGSAGPMAPPPGQRPCGLARRTKVPSGRGGGHSPAALPLVRVMNVRGAPRPRVTGDVTEEVKRRPFRDAAIR